LDYWNGDIQLDVGVEFGGALPEAGEVVRSATPGGATASVVHFGPYAQLGAAHAAICAWSAAAGHRLAGPNWEIYGHWQPEWNTDPSKIRTDVFYQIAPAPYSG
jgi:effector-binding domain-containing protein